MKPHILRTLGLLGGALALAVFAPMAAADTREPPADWYEASWIHSHASISFQAAELDAVSRQIKEAGLDAVQFHPGNQQLWQAFRKTPRDDQRFKMVATINFAGSWHSQYEKDPAYVYRVHPDGSFAGRWDRKHLCFNAPVVRERIIPEKYGSMPAKLQPDQVWIDENIITVNLCWCPHCAALYRQQYKVAPPTRLTADNHAEWTQWVTFHRRSFERWMDDVRKSILTAVPQTLVTFNHAWFVDQPESPPAGVKNLSADIHHDHLKLGIYARYGGSGPIPFDLMPGLGDDVWAGVRPKSQDRILNDVALIIAHGGRWNVGEYPTNATSIGRHARLKGVTRRPAERYDELARAGAAFARERQTFSQHSKPVPEVAVLHAASTHYDHVIRNVGEGIKGSGFGTSSDGGFLKNDANSINSRIYWPNNNPIADSLIGTYQALLENHLHFNFTIEDRLAADLKEVSLLVLPEQHRLSPDSLTAITSYVRNGGRVLATGSTRRAGLDEIFDYQSEAPKRFGKGQTLYLPEDLFREYYQSSGYSRKPKGNGDQLRDRAAGIFKRLLPKPAYSLDAPPWIEWTLRRSANDKELLLHLINRKLNWSGPDSAAVPLRLSLALPARPDLVTLEPGSKALEWAFSEGKLRLSLNPTSVPRHRIIRIKHRDHQR